MDLMKGIDLSDSFVLGWSLDQNILSFELEASVWPESEHYVSPKPNEYTCYRKASLKFIGVQSVTGLKPIESVNPSFSSDGTKDFGNIELLDKTEGGFEFSGDFGSVKVLGGELLFEVYT